jgi:carboxyl-terminal processing protease
MRSKVLPGVILCVFLAACGVDAAEPQSTYDISTEALAYLDTALDLVQKHSINREEIDWDDLRTRAYRRASGAQTTADTYSAIRYALRDLGDSHSLLLTPEQVAQVKDGTANESLPDASGKLLEGRLGYVFLPSWVGSAGEGADKHATTVQDIIRDLDTQVPCGWIVDLRENKGGSMWPMLAGIGPILGEGFAGSFVVPDGSQDDWYYMDGQALMGDDVQTEVNGDVYTLSKPLPPVAVLTGPATSSAGEAIMVAFRGRPDTCSFGQGTSGQSTANQGFVLSDGAWLLVTVSRFADRTGQVYGSMIEPDEIVNWPKGEDDPTLRAATEWLLGQPACSVSS